VTYAARAEATISRVAASKEMSARRCARGGARPGVTRHQPGQSLVAFERGRMLHKIWEGLRRQVAGRWIETVVLAAVAAEALGPAGVPRSAERRHQPRAATVVIVAQAEAADQAPVARTVGELDGLESLADLEALRALRPIGGPLDHSPLAAFDFRPRAATRPALDRAPAGKGSVARVRSRPAASREECAAARERAAARAAAAAAKAAAANLRRHAAV